MSVNKERMTILRMVEEGKISPEEGAELLAAVGEQEAQTASQNAESFDMSSTLRIRVMNTVTGICKANVSLPIGLVHLGLRFVPQSADVDTEAIQAALDSGMRGCIVDVEDEEDGVHVQIFIE